MWRLERQGGTVQEIGLVYTKLTTIDNRRILMPNSLVVDAQVTNYTTEPLRRVDLTVSASYDAPVEKVKQTIQGVLKDHDKNPAGPAPLPVCLGMGDSAMEYTIRVWCESGGTTGRCTTTCWRRSKPPLTGAHLHPLSPTWRSNFTSPEGPDRGAQRRCLLVEDMLSWACFQKEEGEG